VSQAQAKPGERAIAEEFIESVASSTRARSSKLPRWPAAAAAGLLRIGDSHNLDGLLRRLCELAYVRVARRGGRLRRIIDEFVPIAEHPAAGWSPAKRPAIRQRPRGMLLEMSRSRREPGQRARAGAQAESDLTVTHRLPIVTKYITNVGIARLLV
jgi:hypothetical protein